MSEAPLILPRAGLENEKFDKYRWYRAGLAALDPKKHTSLKPISS